MWPCSSLDPWNSLWAAISLRYQVLLFTLSLHTRARLRLMGERWESEEREESPGPLLSDEIA